MSEPERLMAETAQDAREFGLHLKQGGWRLGLLVARNVQPGNGRGGDRRSDQSDSRRNDPGAKISALAFAAASGTSDHRVTRYYEAWERAADKGHVPHASELTPTDEPKMADPMPPWEWFYSSPVGRNVDEKREQAIRQEARNDGVGEAKAVDVASNPNAMAAAIKADNRAAEAARRALAEYDRRESERRKAESEARRREEEEKQKTTTLEVFVDDTIAALANLLDPEFCDVGRRLAYLEENLSTLSEEQRQRLARAVIELGARVSAWEDRVRGISGHTVGEGN